MLQNSEAVLRLKSKQTAEIRSIQKRWHQDIDQIRLEAAVNVTATPSPRWYHNSFAKLASSMSPLPKNWVYPSIASSPQTVHGSHIAASLPGTSRSALVEFLKIDLGKEVLCTCERLLLAFCSSLIKPYNPGCMQHRFVI